MKFIMLTHHYSGFQIHNDDTKLTLEWYGPIDFTGAESIGLTNVHIFPLRHKKNSYSAIIQANFVQPTLYNPEKVLSTIRIDPHSDHTPVCNFKGRFSIVINLDVF